MATVLRRAEQLVRPGGPVAIQAITMPHHRMLATRHTQTWVKYIFPGGLLYRPHPGHRIAGQHTGLRIVDAASLFTRRDAALWRRRSHAAGEMGWRI